MRRAPSSSPPRGGSRRVAWSRSVAYWSSAVRQVEAGQELEPLADRETRQVVGQQRSALAGQRRRTSLPSRLRTGTSPASITGAHSRYSVMSVPRRVTCTGSSPAAADRLVDHVLPPRRQLFPADRVARVTDAGQQAEFGLQRLPENIVNASERSSRLMSVDLPAPLFAGPSDAARSRAAPSGGRRRPHERDRRGVLPERRLVGGDHAARVAHRAAREREVVIRALLVRFGEVAVGAFVDDQPPVAPRGFDEVRGGARRDRRALGMFTIRLNGAGAQIGPNFSTGRRCAAGRRASRGGSAAHRAAAPAPTRRSRRWAPGRRRPSSSTSRFATATRLMPAMRKPHRSVITGVSTPDSSLRSILVM